MQDVIIGTPKYKNHKHYDDYTKNNLYNFSVVMLILVGNIVPAPSGLPEQYNLNDYIYWEKI